MKKLKLLVSALLASTMIIPVLSACDETTETEKGIVSNVTLSKTTAEIYVGEEFTVTATVNVLNGAAKTLRWSVVDEMIATILTSNDGGCVFAGLKEGSTFLKATSTVDDTKFASLKITVNAAKVTSVVASGSETLEFCKDTTQTIRATVTVEGPASKALTWTINDTSVATIASQDETSVVVRGLKAGQTTLKVASVADPSKFDTVVLKVFNPEVASVTTVGSNKVELALDETTSVSVGVTTKGTAENLSKIDWTVTGNCIEILSVSSDYLTATIKGLSAGTATLIATSAFDINKKASFTVTVIDKGFMPEIYDMGYSFSYDFPSELAEAFATVEVPEFTADGGYYYANVPAQQGSEEYGPTAPYFEIIFPYTAANLKAATDVYNATDFTKLYDSYYETLIYLDPTNTAEFDIGYYALDEDGEELVGYLTIYHVADIWKTSEDTEDNEWNEELSAALEELGFELPFVKLGAAYDFESDAEELYLEVYDLCVDSTKLDNYGQTLISEGFESRVETYEDESYTVYVKPINDYLNEVVYFEFGVYGNSIMVSVERRALTAFPTELVANYVTNTIGSKYSVTNFVGSTDVTYLASPASTYVGDDEVECLQIVLDGASIDELNTYIASLEGDGFVLDEEASFEKQDGYSISYLQKGKIVVAAYTVYQRPLTEAELDYYLNLTEEDMADFTEEQYYEYLDIVFTYVFGGTPMKTDYTIDPEIYLCIFDDESGMEDAGLYIKESTISVGVGKTSELTVTKFDIDQSLVVTFTSEDESVATVDANGVVTGVAFGETTITASIADTSYTDTVKVIVEKTSDDAYDALNQWLLTQGIEDALELPEIVGGSDYEYGYDEEYECYSISCVVDNESTDMNFANACVAAGYEVTQLEDYSFLIVVGDVEIVFYVGYSEDETDENAYFCIDVYVGSEEDAGATFDYSAISDLEVSVNGYTLSAFKTGNEAPPAIYYNKELRLYSGNNLVISSENEITVIDFYTCDCSKNVGANFTASTGTLTTTDYGYHWEGSAYSVTFTCTKKDDNHKQTHFFEIVVNGGGSGGGTTTSTEFPMADVINALDGGTTSSFPVPNGTSFEFELDQEYPQSCYVDIHGGNMTEYLSALEAAGFDVEDYLDDYDCYSATAPSEDLVIDIYPGTSNSEYYINIYCVEPPLTEFPADELAEYLEYYGVTTAAPLPTGEKFVIGSSYYGEFPVIVYGGNVGAYMSQLTSNSFSKDESHVEDWGCVVFTKDDLEIDVYDFGDGVFEVDFMPASY